MIEIDIPDYDCTEAEASLEHTIDSTSENDDSKVDLNVYDDYLEELLASDMFNDPKDVDEIL
ncbi:hypothetical protein IW150_003532 [Coemansia sp. RSA 2607]|nr:hypothetical protein IW150_003532 [Coemansia sp. RSA 2607]